MSDTDANVPAGGAAAAIASGSAPHSAPPVAYHVRTGRTHDMTQGTIARIHRRSPATAMLSKATHGGTWQRSQSGMSRSTDGSLGHPDIVVSRDGGTILLRCPGGWHRIDTASGRDTPLDPGSARISIDLRVEWAKGVDEAWHLDLDLLWDPRMRGLD